MEAAEVLARQLLAQHGTLLRIGKHEVYRLSNGHCVSIRRSGKKGNNDQWKSALSFIKRTLRLPAVARGA